MRQAALSLTALVQPVTTMEQLQQAKHVDDIAFNGQHGISWDELLKLYYHGRIVLLMLPNNQVIGESQLLLQPIPELPYVFEHPVGYCYGTALLPQYQGQGLGVVLGRAQEAEACAAGITELHMTIKPENYPSLRLRIGMGYEVFDYDPRFYGDNPATDARLLLRKRCGMATEHIAANPSAAMKFVPVNFHSLYDYQAHVLMEEVLKKGMVGRYVDKKGMYFFD